MADDLDLAAALAGDWRLARTIEGEGATMAGAARFTPDGTGALRYREEGVLSLRDGRTLAAFRRYRFLVAPRRLTILFDDGPDAGAPFVDLRFGRDWTARAVHPCGDDRYDVAYRLRLPDAFETIVAVSGPRKAYRAISRYTR